MSLQLKNISKLKTSRNVPCYEAGFVPGLPQNVFSLKAYNCICSHILNVTEGNVETDQDRNVKRMWKTDFQLHSENIFGALK